MPRMSNKKKPKPTFNTSKLAWHREMENATLIGLQYRSFIVCMKSQGLEK